VRADRFGYVSSSSVYRWGQHVDESSPLVEPEGDDYAAVKRRGELASLAAFPDALLARAGLILGPHEDIGRLPWWLDRIARGGRLVAPGRPDRPLQLVDARDLAAWLLTGLAEGRSGAVDVISRSGHTTMRGLLEACIAATASDAELVWFSEQELADAGVEPWTQLPCWVPEQGEYAGFLESDTELAARTGLVCRSITDTVADTWDWLQREGPPPQRPDRAVHGLPEAVERALLTSRATE
jgi:nucleoside-diphosphate-sugar epimerase